MNKRNLIPIREYESFVSGREAAGCITLPEHTFGQLEKFLLLNRGRGDDALELMGLSARKGIGKMITAKNYIGLIAMNDGIMIEILPKICSKTDDGDSRVKRLVVEMLRSLRDMPYKSVQTAHVNVDRMNLFEIFIRMFLDEVFAIVKRGLQSGYKAVESNENTVKGKIVFPEHIKRNFAHKERTFVKFDEFNHNRPENKLIKAALLYLYRKTTSIRNKADIKTLLNMFAGVDASTDHEGDFITCVSDRNMRDYETALLWCRVFLIGRSFTSFAGSEVAYALLFPMEILFERFVALKLKKLLSGNEFQVSVQDRTYHLFDDPDKRFSMRPDIVVRRKSDGVIFVMDTKWKLLSNAKANYGIAQADMYQMYAYQKKYAANSVILLYPMTDMVSDKAIEFHSGDGVTVRVMFLDLFELAGSLKKIYTLLKN